MPAPFPQLSPFAPSGIVTMSTFPSSDCDVSFRNSPWRLKFVSQEAGTTDADGIRVCLNAYVDQASAGICNVTSSCCNMDIDKIEMKTGIFVH
eukprot:gene3881-13946_t